MKRTYGKAFDSEYIKMMMKDVKKYPDVIEMYSKFYRGISRGDFEFSSDKNYSIGHKTNYIALGMMTAAALTGIDSCVQLKFHQKREKLCWKKNSVGKYR
jgi:hypothetical protein